MSGFQRCKWYSFLFLTMSVSGVIMFMGYTYKRGTSNHGTANLTLPNTFLEAFALTSLDETCEEMCYSESCIALSDMLLESVDENVDPCEDFYAYVCGKFERYQTNTDFQGERHMFEALPQKMIDVLENIDAPENTPSGKLKIVYDTCVNEKTSEMSAVPTIMENLAKMGMRGWPHLEDDFRFTRPSLYESLAVIESYRKVSYTMGNPIIGVYASDNAGYPAKLKIMNGFMNEEPDKKTFPGLVLQILHHFGVSGGRAKSILKDFTEIYYAIRRIFESGISARPGYLTLHEIDCKKDARNSEEFGQICVFLKHYVEYNNLAPRYSAFQATVTHLPYIMEVFTLIESFPQRALSNYFALCFVLEHRDHLSKSIRLASPMVDEENGDVDYIYIDKRKYCAKWAARFMRGIFAAEYVKQKLSDEVQNEVRQIVNTYSSVSAYTLGTQNWIEESRRKQFADLIQRVNYNLDGYLHTLLQTNILQNWYSDFMPNKESFLQNVLAETKHLQKRLLLDFKDEKTIAKILDLFQVNAVHVWEPTLRISLGMEMMFGFFETPVFEHGRSKLVNLATLGEFVGHELGHYIQTFFEFNETLDEMTATNYQLRKNCLMNQYSEFEIPKIGEKLDAMKTFEENEADIMGLDLFEKFLGMYLEKGVEEKFLLPASNHTLEQILYIAKEQFYCQQNSIEELRRQYETDVHATEEHRVLGKAMNSRRFSKIFNCKEGSRMNVAHKCNYFE